MSDSKKEIAHAYRSCTGCGAVLDVTYLLPGRKYRCQECNKSFTHRRELQRESRPDEKPVRAWQRCIGSGLFTVAMVALVGAVSELLLSEQMFWGISAGAGIVAGLGAWGASYYSRDGSAFMSCMLIAAALGTLTMMAHAPPPADFETERTLMFIVIAWLGIGGISFSRFLRNRTALPAVGPAGKVMSDSAEES